MNLRKGTDVMLDRAVWRDIEPADRTARNVTGMEPEFYRVLSCDWVPPHQRILVRMVRRVDNRYEELALTPHELAMNGACNG